MFYNRIYQVLIAIALVTIGFPLNKQLAYAQSDPIYRPDPFPEGAAVYSLSSCWSPDSPKVNPVPGFDLTLLNATRQKIQQNPSAINRAFFLRHLAVEYSCNHDVDVAVEIIDEALVNAKQIEDVYWRATRMLSIAIAYHEAFDKTESANSVMQEVEVISRTLLEGSEQQITLNQAIVRGYSRIQSVSERGGVTLSLDRGEGDRDYALSEVEQGVQALVLSLGDLYYANESDADEELAVDAVLLEMEVLISTEPNLLIQQDLQIDLALLHLYENNLEAARRLSHPSAISKPGQLPATYHPELISEWIGLLFALEDYDLALQVAQSAGDDSNLTIVANNFLAIGEVGYAWESFESVVQPIYQARGLAQFAKTYLKQEQPKTAHNLMVRAVTLAEMVEIDGEGPSWAGSRHKLLTHITRHYVSDADTESVQALVSLMGDRNTRIATLLDAARGFSANIIPHPDWPFDEADNFSSAGLTDDVLLKIVARAARRDLLHQAIKAVAVMRSPEVQVTGLMIAQMYTDIESTAVEDETLSLLQSILEADPSEH